MAKKTTKRRPSSRGSRVAPPDWTKFPEFVEGYSYDHELADAPAQFIEGLCRHPGENGPQRITLIQWQRERVIRPLFGWRRPDGRLRYRRAGIFVPKKNRKSSLMSQLAQYIVCCHGHDVFLAANDRLQARTMFRMVKQSVEASPHLSRMLEVVDSRSIIRNRDTGSEIRCLSADSYRNEGLNGSVILDEIHSFRSPDLVDALMYATRGTANGIVMSISTAGDSRNGVGWQWWTDCEIVQKSPAANPTFYGLVYAAKEDDPRGYGDPAVWREANPSMGIAFPEDEFAADYEDAKTDPRKFGKWLRYSLNVWEAADSRFFQGDSFAACQLPPPEPLAGRPVAVGVDLASNIDMTAVAFVAKSPDGSYDVEMRYFVPEETVADAERKSRIPYSTWIREGWVIPTPGARLDHERVAQEILRYGEDHQLLDVGVDPWQVGLLATLLERAGVSVKAIRQATASLNAPMKLMEGLVAERKLRYTSPVLLFNANNLCVYQDPTGLVKPDKAKSREKIDGCVALVNALAVAMTADEQMDAPGENDWDIVRL